MEGTYNKYQTQLTEEVLATLSKEESDKLFEYINGVEFIQRLISPNRKYAKDLPRDDRGRIIIDVCNPHILENMDYFREMALYYKENGVYTKLKPNPNPSSEFGQLIKREITRILDGMVRPEDGEWITGEMYFYINYWPIAQTKVKKGSKQADRVVDFPEIWEGTYLLTHYLQQARYGGVYDFDGGCQASIIARRGCGKSYLMSSVLGKSFTVGDNLTAMEKVTGIITAYEKGYLNSDGTLNKFVDGIDFLAEHCPFFPSARAKNSFMEMDWIMGYQDADSGVVKGTKNEVIGFSSKDNPDKGRGKRAAKFIFEEFGNFPKFINTWNTTIPSVKEGDFSYGIIITIGTGGSENSDFSGALELIYHPEGYGIYALPNVFDKATKGKSTSVFFWGAYLNRKGYYNEDGVSDVIGALISEIKERIKIKYNSSDPLTLTQRTAEWAITIQEAVLKRDGTIYPVGDLNERVTQINSNPKFRDELAIGDIVLKGGAPIFSPNTDMNPVWEFPHKDNKREGAICIYKMPVKDSNGVVMRGRFIGACDPYDDDSSETLSLGALYILDLYTDELVAEYVGRPMFAEEFYENCRKLLLFYNAECNYENNKKGLFKHFSQYNSLYLLSPTLDFLKEKQLMKEGLYGNKSYGTIATEPIKTYARRAIRDWLLKPRDITSVTTTEDGRQVEEITTIRNLYTIPFKSLCQELALWNSDGNFDRHDALAMLMLLREDKLRLLGADGPKNMLKNTGDELANDKFFEVNYKSRSDRFE